MSRPPACIKRWSLRLQEYHFTTVHTKGHNNPFLSWHPCPEVLHADDQLNGTLILSLITPYLKQCQWQNWAEQTNGPSWKMILTCQTWMLLNWSFSRRIEDELTINYTNDPILKGTRIVIPSELCQWAFSSWRNCENQATTVRNDLVQWRIQTFPREGANIEQSRTKCVPNLLGHTHFHDHAHKTAANEHNGCS